MEVTAVPERFEILVCIGCGALNTRQPCLGPCEDNALDLVRASDHDAVAAHAKAERERARPLLEVVRDLAGLPSTDDHAESLYRTLQRRAREALREAGSPASVPAPEPFRAWFCGGCGRIEAPQPCLGVCVRQPEYVVRADYHAEAVAQAADAERDAHALQDIVRRLAWVSPRDGRFQVSLNVLRADALGLLGAGR